MNKQTLILAIMVPVATGFIIAEHIILRAICFLLFVAIYYMTLWGFSLTEKSETNLRKKVFSLQGNMSKQKRKLDELEEMNEVLTEQAYEYIRLDLAINSMPKFASVRTEDDLLVYESPAFKSVKKFDEITSVFILRCNSIAEKQKNGEAVRKLN
jgi:hypothetical protein